MRARRISSSFASSRVWATKLQIFVCFCIPPFLCQFSVCARFFNNAKVFESQCIRCSTVATQTTTLGPKKGTKRRRHFSSIFWEKASFFFASQKGQLTSPWILKVGSVSAKHQLNPLHHSPFYLISSRFFIKSNISIYPYSFIWN